MTVAEELARIKIELEVRVLGHDPSIDDVSAADGEIAKQLLRVVVVLEQVVHMVKV